MSNSFIFSKQEEIKFVNYVEDEDWCEATNFVYDRVRDICLSVFRKSGRIFDGNFVEPEDFLHDTWLNIYKYIAENKCYMEANSPLGYVIKHIQKFTLRLDSNDTKELHLFQDTRYAGSQRIPYRQRIRGSYYKEQQTISYDQMQGSGEKNIYQKEVISGDNGRIDEEPVEIEYINDSNLLAQDVAAVYEEELRTSSLTKEKIYNLIYQQIADIKKVIDIDELNMRDEPELFLTNSERG